MFANKSGSQLNRVVSFTGRVVQGSQLVSATGVLHITRCGKGKEGQKCVDPQTRSEAEHCHSSSQSIVIVASHDSDVALHCTLPAV